MSEHTATSAGGAPGGDAHRAPRTRPTDAHPGPTPGDPPPARPRGSRRRWAAILGGALAVVAVGAVVVGALDGRQPGPAPAAPTVVLPSPTPTVAPMTRAPVSPFADALPASVLDHALTALAEEVALLVAGAVEGYRLTYSDGAGGVVTVLAGQWPTPQDAAAALTAATAGAVPVDDGEPASGDVVVDGVTAGRWVLADAGDGTGTLTWTNGTALLQAVAPLDTVRDVYAAYGM